MSERAQLPEFPIALDAAGKFPFPEGEQWEYKANNLDRIKLYKTICAMLNASGGYLVAGVRDDLTVCGVSMESKRFDMLALHIDDIWHCAHIVQEDGSKLGTNCVKAELRKFTTYTLLVITVRPEEHKRYKLKNGEFWVRLSASNYCVAESQLVEPHIVQDMIRQREILIQKRETTAAHQRESALKKEYSAVLRNFQAELAERRKSEGLLMNLLKEKILQEKERAELAMKKQRDTNGIVQAIWTLLSECFSISAKESAHIIDAAAASLCGAEKC